MIHGSSGRLNLSAIDVPFQYRVKNRELHRPTASVSHESGKRYRPEMTHKKTGTALLLLAANRIA
jgi:hypothetical protein